MTTFDREYFKKKENPGLKKVQNIQNVVIKKLAQEL